MFWLIVGLLIGWNLPQPAIAKRLQDNLVDKLKDWVERR